MGSPMAVAAEAGPDRFWDTYSRYYDCVYQLMPYRKLLWDAFEALELEPGMRVLDAGCGTGNFEHFIAEKNHPPVTIDAVDFSTEMLSRAKAKCRGLDNVTFQQADLGGRLPFEDATFDRIVSINVLYALPDPDTALRELVRVLKPQGRIILSTPAPGYAWGPLVADHFRRVKNIWGVRRRVTTVAKNVGVICTTMVASFVLNVVFINRRASAGDYHVLAEPDLRSLLDLQREGGIGEYTIGPAYAEQNLFAMATKTVGYAGQA
jgi:ubiquinone/menaquinone biosynthesis C-methylase UbiE